jgi:hypothetical protein
LDRALSISSLLRIFPDAVFGTVLMNVTLRNLLKGATCKQIGTSVKDLLISSMVRDQACPLSYLISNELFNIFLG